MPGLLTLKTDLKSLKYGQDQPGGGSSGQPYIQNDINDPTNILRLDDGFIRGGAIGAANASLIDKKRIELFFKDEPQGTLFIARQVGLQFSNPRLEVKKGAGAFASDLLTGNIGNALGTITGGILGPTRIYNLGINTLAQVPVNAIGGHIIRHGLLPIQSDESKYEAIVEYNNERGNNRLLGLKKKFKLGDRETSGISTIDRVLGFVSNAAQSIGLNIPGIQPKQLVVDDYLGGPGSVYGIGGTIINRASFTEDKTSYEDAVKNYIYAGKTRDDKGNVEEIDYSRGLGKGDNAIDNYFNTFEKSEQQNPNYLEEGIVNYATIDPFKNYRSPSLRTYASIRKDIDQQKSLENSFRAQRSGSELVGYVNQFGIYDKENKSYSTEDVGFIGYKNTYNDKVILKFSNWADISRENRVGSGRKDSINLTPIFSQNDVYWYNNTTPDGQHNIRDLVKFAIQAINTNSPSTSNFMIFRAYLTQFSDSVESKWSDINYVGRGNPFYVYNGFTRRIQIGFKVAALSAEEMQPMYSKLNYLMSNLMPDYENNLMRGPLVRMTVGNYLDAQLGKLDSLTYTIPEESPWEIAIDEPEGGTKMLILPHVIEVQMNFTPIGAETGVNVGETGSRASNKIEEKSKNTSYLAQNTTGIDKGKIQYYSDFPLPPKQNQSVVDASGTTTDDTTQNDYYTVKP